MRGRLQPPRFPCRLKTHVEPRLVAHVADAFIGVPSDVDLPEVAIT